MYIGTQGRFEDDTQLEVLAQLGVNHVDHTSSEPWTEWSTEMMVALRERFDKLGINLEMMHIPLRGRPATLAFRLKDVLTRLATSTNRAGLEAGADTKRNNW